MTGSFRLSSRFLRIATFAALFIGSTAQAAQALAIDVHRDANCGCCKKWIQHLEANGFTVIDHVETNMSAVKQDLGVAPRLSSCHTAMINGKFVEGHVPAEQIIAMSKRETFSESPPLVCQQVLQEWKSTECMRLTRSSAGTKLAQIRSLLNTPQTNPPDPSRYSMVTVHGHAVGLALSTLFSNNSPRTISNSCTGALKPHRITPHRCPQ